MFVNNGDYDLHYYQLKIPKIFKIRRKAVVRTIDFLVSFILFIILVTQFYLIIININLNLASTSTKQENPAQQLASKILGSTGSSNWGTTNGDPATFGLASDNYYSSLNPYLDLTKFSRLNKELNYLDIANQYSFIEPDTLISNLTGNQGGVEFRLSTRPVIQIIVNSVLVGGTSSTISVRAMTWGNSTLSNIDIDVYHVLLSDGSNIAKVSSTTDINGEATIVTTIGANNYVAVIYAHSKDSWGITWSEINNGAGTISSSLISSFMMNNPIINRNSVLQYTNSSTTDNIFTNSAFYSKELDSLNNLGNTGSGALIYSNNTNVGTSGPYIQVHTMVSGGISYYRVVTLPLIFNNFNYTTPETTLFTTTQYPVYQSSNFPTTGSVNVQTYSTIVMTIRGPIFLTIELAE